MKVCAFIMIIMNNNNNKSKEPVTTILGSNEDSSQFLKLTVASQVLLFIILRSFLISHEHILDQYFIYQF